VLISTGEMIGVEALLRWRDPVRGMIPPDSFIRQCENTGRMAHVTRHVLAEACRAGKQLAAQGAPVSVAVNISATMLHDRSIVAMVREVLHQTGFDPRHLTLEITETSRISDFAVAGEILGELNALGSKISMDDFGVGAASLEALLQLPFAEIKIDRLFISQMTHNPKALGIVRSILALGKQLRAVVVAEGVEDRATLELLREGGCRVAQGYGILRPASLDDIVQFRDRSRKSKGLLSI
jgi:EAL domain-containing protein (putative c-di-GMP-specific phosphodiesterase class I)